MDRSAQVLDRLKGPVVPLNICFNEDGTVHYEAVEKYVDWLCEQGPVVLLLTAGSSEFAYLSEKEIYELTALVGRVNQGRSLYIASTGLWKPSLTRDFLAHADRAGADAVKVQISPWMPQTREVIVGYYDLIEGASDIPLLLWVITPPIPLEVAAELSQRPHIVGMKNDADPFGYYYDVIRATRENGFAVVSGGQMRNFMFGYPLGSPAYLCPIAPFRPDVALEFGAVLAAGQTERAWEMVLRYEEPFLQWAIERDWLSVMKSTIQLLGLYPNNRPAPPQPAPPPELLDEVRGKLQELFA